MKPLSCLIAWVVLSGVCFATEITRKQIDNAVQVAARLECEIIQSQIERATKKLKQPSRDKNETRAKVAVKRQITAAQKRIKDLQAGKVLPTLELNPFRLAEGQIGRLPQIKNGVLQLVGKNVEGIEVLYKTSSGGFTLYDDLGPHYIRPQSAESKPFWIVETIEAFTAFDDGRSENKYLKTPANYFYVRVIDNDTWLIPVDEKTLIQK